MPIVPVGKKTTDKVHTATLNPLPHMDDIFASLTQGAFLSKVDLVQACQMEIEESTRKYMTINTHKDLYQYGKIVFGITSAPVIWVL